MKESLNFLVRHLQILRENVLTTHVTKRVHSTLQNKSLYLVQTHYIGM